MGLATIGLTVLFLPAISMTNELLGLPISRSAVTEGVVLLSLLISPLYSGGYLSSNRLWNTTLVFVSSTIGLLLVGVVVVYFIRGSGQRLTTNGSSAASRLCNNFLRYHRDNKEQRVIEKTIFQR